MVLAGRGPLDLAASLGEVLPAKWLPPDSVSLTLRSLLTHRSGLPAWRPFYQEVLAAPPEARPTFLERLAATALLEYPSDTATLYSDLGFMLLKAVVERVSGETLKVLPEGHLPAPGPEYFGFHPSTQNGPGCSDPARPGVRPHGPFGPGLPGLFPHRYDDPGPGDLCPGDQHHPRHDRHQPLPPGGQGRGNRVPGPSGHPDHPGPGER